jgi:uncharacterized protein (TIGR03545 family)
MTSVQRAIFRWRAIGPLLLFLGLLALGWALFSDRIARRSLEEVATQVLGTQVDIEWLRLRERDLTVEMGGLAVADPFDPTRNILEVGHLVVDLEPRPLLERKVVIRRLALGGLDVGVPRETPARPVEGGAAARTAQALAGWRDRLDQPMLGIAAADSLRQLVLQPEELETVRTARAIMGRADSVREAMAAQVVGLDPAALVDESRRVAEQVGQANPTALGLAGMRQLVSDARSVVQRLDEAEARMDTLGSTLGNGAAALRSGVAALDGARDADHRRAAEMIGAPSLEAPAIGGALFGDVSLSYLQRAFYWMSVVRQYMPPGLQPRTSPAGHRLRASGKEVHFPKEGRSPSFHLIEGSLSQAEAPAGDARHTFDLTDISSAPALVAQPARMRFRRLQDDRERLAFDLAVDHRRQQPLDSLMARAGAVTLPSFDLPGTGLTLVPGAGATGLTAVLDGDRFAATFSVEAPALDWQTRTEQRPEVAGVLEAALRGVSRLEVTATLGGTLQGLDEFRVRSNIDDAVASGLRAAAGEAVMAARARARAEVDRLTRAVVDSASTSARTALEEATVRLTAWQGQVAAAREELERQLQAKTGGVRLF